MKRSSWGKKKRKNRRGKWLLGHRLQEFMIGIGMIKNVEEIRDKNLYILILRF